MSSCSSSTTASTGPDQRRLSAAAPTFDPSMASSSSMAATTAGVPGSSPAMAPLLTSARMSSGSSASSTTSFDPAGSSALAPARSPRPGLSASAPAFYPTTASSSSTPVMPAVPGFLPQIPEPTASCSGKLRKEFFVYLFVVSNCDFLPGSCGSMNPFCFDSQVLILALPNLLIFGFCGIFHGSCFLVFFWLILAFLHNHLLVFLVLGFNSSCLFGILFLKETKRDIFL